MLGRIDRDDIQKIAPNGGKGIFLLPDNVPDCYLLPAYKHKSNARGGVAAEGRPCLVTDAAGTHLDIRMMGIPTCDIGRIISGDEKYYWKDRPKFDFASNPGAHIAASFAFLETELQQNNVYLFVPYGGEVKNNDDSIYTKRDTRTTPSFGGSIGLRGEHAIQLRCKIEEYLVALQLKYGTDIGKTKSKIDLISIEEAVAKYQTLVSATRGSL